MKRLSLTSIQSTLLIFYIAQIIFFSGCKEFIEPSITKSKVVQLAPTNGSESKQYSQTFWWETVEDALKYRLQVVSPDFDNTVRLILDTLVEINKFNYTLDPGSYEWRLRAENGSSHTNYAHSKFFIYSSSIIEQHVQLQLPSNNELVIKPVTLRWDVIATATKYQLYVYRTESRVLYGTKFPVSLTSPSFIFTEGSSGDKIYWAVMAVDEAGNLGAYSELRSFVIQ